MSIPTTKARPGLGPDGEAPPPAAGGPTDSTGQPGPRRRRWWSVGAAIAAVLVVSLVLAGLVALHRPVTLPEGYSYRTQGNGVHEVHAGQDDARLVVDGTTGGIVQVSVSNEGRFPVTILGLDNDGVAPTATAIKGISFMPRFDQMGTMAARTRVTTAVTLGHGDEAAVLLDVRFDKCVPMEQGASYDYDAIRVKIRRLGVTTTAQIQLPLPLYVSAVTAHPPAAGCPGA